MTAIAFSGVVCGPISGWIMQAAGGGLGLAGWQWLFLLEGLPSLVVGTWVLFRLDDSISAACWLAPAEKTVLAANIAAEAGTKPANVSLWRVLTNGRILLLAVIYFLLILGLYGIGFWLPQLIKNTGIDAPLDVGLISAIPYGGAAIAMIMVSRHSDRTGERRWHTALAALAGGLGLVGCTFCGSRVGPATVMLTIATAGILTSLPIFWTLPTEFLTGAAAATGIAMINPIGNLAGFASPYLLGIVQDRTGSTDWGLYAIAGSLLLGGALVVCVPPPRVGADAPGDCPGRRIITA